MITYQQEGWSSYYTDCQALWHEHYAELATNKDSMQMSPDIETYKALEQQGNLLILTARENGTLIGYQIAVVRRHLHYSTLCGFEDAYFLTKAKRQGMIGVRLITESLKLMKQRGVQKVFFMTKNVLNKGLIFERLGFTRSDITYSKWIGN